MYKLLIAVTLFCSTTLWGQELYPSSEPASNMPSKSISYKLNTMYGQGMHSTRVLQRYNPEVMFGLNKNWMLHTSLSFSDMHDEKFIFESVKAYLKYRFLSIDEVHKHFRMAVFTSASYSRNHLDHNELSLSGDHSGIQSGIIATQLWNKFALSGTFNIISLLNPRYKSANGEFEYDALNYSLSTGYLVLPINYTSYNQLNLNIYAELLVGKNLSHKEETYYTDLAPAVQLIFNSTSKLNIGYRFQLKSDIERLMKSSFMISYEHIFLNALRKNKN